MELLTLYFNLLIFYIELSIGFWITRILKKENPKIESFPPSADLALDNIKVYIYVLFWWSYKPGATEYVYIILTYELYHSY